jgi:tetratricopeptide (TPR) repeat protein
MSMKHEKEAIALWHKAVDIAPDYLYPYLSLGTLYYTKKNFLAGERMLIEARKQYTTPNVIMLLAINQTGLRKYPEAIATIENQFGKYPEAFELRFALGFAYLKSGQEQKAWELLMPLKDPRSTDEMFKAQLRKMGVLQIEMP